MAVCAICTRMTLLLFPFWLRKEAESEKGQRERERKKGNIHFGWSLEDQTVWSWYVPVVSSVRGRPLSDVTTVEYGIRSGYIPRAACSTHLLPSDIHLSLWPAPCSPRTIPVLLLLLSSLWSGISCSSGRVSRLVHPSPSYDLHFN